MSTANERLAEIGRKIERAKEYVRDLERRWRAFLETGVDTVLREKDPETGNLHFKLRVANQSLPSNFPLIIGDAIHNLRLDHLVFQLVPEPSRTTRMGFPIYDTLAKYVCGRMGKIKGMASGAIHLIDAMNPYKGGKDALWKLHRLDIADKHHPLPPPDAAWAIIEGSRELLHISPVGNCQDEMKVETAFEPAVHEPQITEREPIIPLLHNLTHFVESSIIPFGPYLCP